MGVVLIEIRLRGRPCTYLADVDETAVGSDVEGSVADVVDGVNIGAKRNQFLDLKVAIGVGDARVFFVLWSEFDLLTTSFCLWETAR